MSSIPINADEANRLESLKSYHILDTAEEKDFDDLTELASLICGVPVALISFVDHDRQWFKSHKGTDASETPIEQSFCAHAIVSAEDIMVVEDAKSDARFVHNPLVTGAPNIVFYAGVPLVNEDGFKLGTLCVIDRDRKTLSEGEAAALKIIARQVMDKLELRRKMRLLEISNNLLKQSEEKINSLHIDLNHTYQRVQSMIEQAPVAIIVFRGDDLHIEAVNPPMLELLGKKADIKGRPLLDAIPELEGQPPYDLLYKVYTTGETIYGRNTPVTLFRNGREEQGYFNFSYSPLIEDNKIVGIIDMAYEVTEQRQNEEKKNDFIAMVSHELKTPLTSITAFIQVLERRARKQEDEFAMGALNRASVQVKKMNTMITGFLDVSRLEAGQIHINRQLFDLAELVREAEEESLATITSHQVIFAPVEYTLVEADRDKIGQVISNLISNAVKYSPKGTAINVACVTEGKCARLSVKDEGAGVREQDREKLFDRFYRVENQEMTSIAGFGIGLYICSEIILRHDGKIWVDSEPGKGSVFQFTIPAR